MTLGDVLLLFPVSLIHKDIKMCKRIGKTALPGSLALFSALRPEGWVTPAGMAPSRLEMRG